MIIDFLKILAVAATLAYVGLLILALWMAPSMIFPSPSASYSDEPGALRIALDDAHSVRAVYLGNPDADRLLLFHHGNGEDLGQIRENLETYREHGFAVLAYDYPGYGTSDGSPSANSVAAAAHAVFEHARDTLGWSPQSIISYGRSLGGGPAVILGSEHQLAGVVLEATFTSTYRVITRWRLLPWEVFDNLSRIRRLKCPVLIIHGREDMTVPFRHGEQLLAAAPADAEHLWVDSANHCDIVEVAGERYWAKLKSFAADRCLQHSAVS